MALTVTIFESAWTGTTTPITVSVTGAVTGDWIGVIGGGDQASGNGVTAAAASTTGGSTDPWIDLATDLDSGADVDWYTAAKAQVTGNGTVTVQVSRTKTGAAGGQWGFYAVLANDSAGINLMGQLGTAASTQVISGTVSQGSAVAIGLFDWMPAAPASAWTPAGQTVVEATTVASTYTVMAAYWTGQTAGTRNYGTTNSTSTNIKGVALEILANTGPPPIAPTLRVVRSNVRSR